MAVFDFYNRAEGCIDGKDNSRRALYSCWGWCPHSPEAIQDTIQDTILAGGAGGAGEGAVGRHDSTLNKPLGISHCACWEEGWDCSFCVDYCKLNQVLPTQCQGLRR